MDERVDWKIEDQPAEYQARYWRLRAERLEAELKLERKRKEPDTLRETEEELGRVRRQFAFFQQESKVWQRLLGDALNRVAELEKEGPAEVLRKERDHWRDRWKHCTRRLGNCIEHLGLDHSGTEPNNDQS